MATNKFIGQAAAVAQVNTLTPGTVSIGNIFSCVINTKTVSYTAAAGTAADVTAGLVAAVVASTIAEFLEVTAVDLVGTLTLTAKTAGMPFTVTLTAVQGTGAGGMTLTQTVVNGTGPSDWISTANWSQGVIPQGAVVAPTLSSAAVAAGGALAAGTQLFYKITAINANGETTVSGEVNATPSGANLSVLLTWVGSLAGATGYKIYRGTATNAENVLVATVNSASATTFTDTGETATVASPPGSNTAYVTTPVQSATSLAAGGTLSEASTYYYVVTATTALGETVKSNEQSATPAGGNDKAVLTWVAVTGATGYKIYRSTTAATYGATSLLTTIGSGATVTYTDTGTALTTGTPPGSSTAAIPVPTSSATSTATTGGAVAAATWYYQVTAITAAGETSGATERSQITTGATSTVTVNWSADAGSTGFKVYRGPTAAGEATLIATLGNVTSFIDTGGSNGAGTPPGGNTAVGDDVVIDKSGTDLLYNLNQATILLATLTIRASYTGRLGLPDNGNGYYEYRSRYLQILVPTLKIGDGPGNGSGRLRIDPKATTCAITVLKTAQGVDAGFEALLLLGTSASNTLTVYSGQVGIAVDAASVATYATISVGLITGPGDASIRCESGVTLTTISQNSGTVVVNSAVTTWTMLGGLAVVYGAGACTTLTVDAGTLVYESNGTITTLNIGAHGTADFTHDLRARTITNVVAMDAGATLIDTYATVTFSAGIKPTRCRLQDVSIDVGFNRTLTPS